MKPGREFSGRDRQILRDLDRPAVAPTVPTPIRLATLGYSLPLLIDASADEWVPFTYAGYLAVFRPDTNFDLRSARFLVKLDTGTDGEIVRFDFGLYVVNPTDWRIDVADGAAKAALLNAAVITPTREFSVTRSNLADVAQRTEIYFERPVRLLGGQFYAALIAPRILGESIWCPSGGDTCFALDSGNIDEHIQITAIQTGAPGVELRNELATRVYTGGAQFKRF